MWRAIIGATVALVALFFSQLVSASGLNQWRWDTSQIFSSCYNSGQGPCGNPGPIHATSAAAEASLIQNFSIFANTAPNSLQSITRVTPLAQVANSAGSYCSDWSVAMNNSYALTWNACVKPVNDCPSGGAIDLEVDVSGPAPKAVEYSPVCFEGCQLNISDARIFKTPASASGFSMIGKWTFSGALCTSINAPTQVDSGDVSVDPENPGGAGTGDVGTGGTVGGTPQAPEDTCDPFDTACHKGKIADATGPFTTLPTEASPGPLGAPMLFPFLNFFNYGATRICAVDVPLAGDLAFLRATVGGSVVALDFCNKLDDIDRIGGFLVYMLTAITIYGMFLKTPGT